MPKDIHTLVGRRVRQERQRAGLTIERLAELSGISASFLAYIETQGRKASLDTIQHLAEALRVSVGTLFHDAPEPPKDDIYDAGRQFCQLVRERSPGEREALLDIVRAASKALGKAKKR